MPSLLSDITSSLEPLSDTPALDSSVLLAHILRKPRTWVLAHPELTLTNEQQCQLNIPRATRGGEPFPYVLGHWEFFGMEFEVTPDVLIPRPETELLVEKVIARLQVARPGKSSQTSAQALARFSVSIAANAPHAEILATDISEKALEVAKRNAQKHTVSDRIRFIQCDLLPDPKTPVQDMLPIDIICANLPYIPTDTLYNLPVYGHEPRLRWMAEKTDCD